MVNSGETVTLGGHKVVRVPVKNREQYKCEHCGTRGDSALFTVGVDGCPGRPESLNSLTVCPGGSGCRGHMDQTTEAWRQWKASSSMPSEEVPRYKCEATERGTRAAAQFLRHAERVGMRVEEWQLNTRTIFNVNAEGALVATFRHSKGRYELWVGRNGSITPLRVGAA